MAGRFDVECMRCAFGYGNVFEKIATALVPSIIIYLVQDVIVGYRGIKRCEKSCRIDRQRCCIAFCNKVIAIVGIGVSRANGGLSVGPTHCTATVKKSLSAHDTGRNFFQIVIFGQVIGR